jgi:hypothetical protein
MFSNNDMQVLWFKHDRASCVLDATDHHGKKVMIWETTSTRRHSSWTSSHQILSTTIHLKCLQVLHRSKLLHQRKWLIYRLTWGIFVYPGYDVACHYGWKSPEISVNLIRKHRRCLQRFQLIRAKLCYT